MSNDAAFSLTGLVPRNQSLADIKEIDGEKFKALVDQYTELHTTEDKDTDNES